MLLFVFLIIELFDIRTYLGQKNFSIFFALDEGQTCIKKRFLRPLMCEKRLACVYFCPPPLSICSGEGNPQGGGQKNRVSAKKFLDFAPPPRERSLSHAC